MKIIATFHSLHAAVFSTRVICKPASNMQVQKLVVLTVLARCLRLKCGVAGAADRPVQEIKINSVVIHANPLAGA